MRLILLLVVVGVLSSLGTWYFSQREIQNTSLQAQVDLLKRQGLVPLDEILQMDGYQPEDSQAGVCLCYVRESPQIRLTLDEELTQIQKNDYCFPLEGGATELDGRLYVDRSSLENVLNCRIYRTQEGEYVLAEEELQAHGWVDEEQPLIAHAGGGVLLTDENGVLTQLTYTNSREALVASYNAGYRVIEMDFRLSKDDELCALHSWKPYGGQMKASRWLEQKTEGNLTTLVMEDVLTEMAVNADLYLVLDVKSYQWTDEELMRQYENLRDMALSCGGEQLADRIVPQIYEEREYDLIKEVYDWKSIIYTLYRADDVSDAAVCAFVEGKEDILVVTMPKRRVSAAFTSMLHAAGKLVYTHTVNDTDGLYEWINQGVDGFYTDTITPAAYRGRYS